MPTALEYQESIGRTEIQSRNQQLARYARERLVELPGVEPAVPADGALSAALVAYRLAGGSFAGRGGAIELQKRLWGEYQVEIPVLDRPDGPYVRVSTHFYNDYAEIDRLHVALAESLH
jgi:selenocysteine lyase/cysteine desulfurase